MFFITSAVTVIEGASEAPLVDVSPASGDKCPRCWRIVPQTIADGPHAGLCLRCDDAVGATR
jgi:isoleucyl-tRNA synthetase